MDTPRSPPPVDVPTEESTPEAEEGTRAPKDRSHDEEAPTPPRVEAPQEKTLRPWSEIFSQEPRIVFGTQLKGPEPYELNSERGFIPASVAKLITAAAALDVLGRDFRFTTTVSWKESADGMASSMLVTADGDPTWGLSEFEPKGSSRLQTLAREIAASVKEIRGPIRLRAADPRQEQHLYPSGVDGFDQVQCYASLAKSFNYAANCSMLSIFGPHLARWDAPGLNFPVVLKINKSTQTNLRLSLELTSEGLPGAFVVSGTWKQNRTSPYRLRLPIPTPEQIFLGRLEHELKIAGVLLRPEAEGEGEVAANQTELKGWRFFSRIFSLAPRMSEKSVNVQSVELAKILRVVLKVSDNFLADAVLRRLAVVHGDPAASILKINAEALFDRKNDWFTSLGQGQLMQELSILDGPGLSRENQSTPRALLALLEAFQLRADFDVLWQSLPVAGVDGTLALRLTHPQVRGRVRAKTGTVNGAYQLAGYYQTPGLGSTLARESIPFVILTTTQRQFAPKVYEIQEQALRRLAEAVRGAQRRPKTVPSPKVSVGANLDSVYGSRNVFLSP